MKLIVCSNIWLMVDLFLLKLITLLFLVLFRFLYLYLTWWCRYDLAKLVVFCIQININAENCLQWIMLYRSYIIIVGVLTQLSCLSRLRRRSNDWVRHNCTNELCIGFRGTEHRKNPKIKNRQLWKKNPRKNINKRHLTFARNIREHK